MGRELMMLNKPIAIQGDASPLNIYWAHHTRSKFLFLVRETNSDTDPAIPQPLNQQTIAELLLFNMTICALTFTDRVIH